MIVKSRGKGVQSGISDIRTIANSNNFGLVPTLSLYPIYIVSVSKHLKDTEATAPHVSVS